HRQRLWRLDLEQRNVGLLVAADDLRVEVAPVGELDPDLVGALDHVKVGQDVAVLVDDEAGADALAGGVALEPATQPAARAAAPAARNVAHRRRQRLRQLDEVGPDGGRGRGNLGGRVAFGPQRLVGARGGGRERERKQGQGGGGGDQG